MQMLGQELLDPERLEGSDPRHGSSEGERTRGLGMLPLQTRFSGSKRLAQRQVSMRWPAGEWLTLEGFELHHGRSHWLDDAESEPEARLSDAADLGWWRSTPQGGNVAGTYLHGIFENGAWRRRWLNQLRQRRGLVELPELQDNHGSQRDRLLDRLAEAFERHVNLEPLLQGDA
jgi:adenosylcobyric acid synthase